MFDLIKKTKSIKKYSQIFTKDFKFYLVCSVKIPVETIGLSHLQGYTRHLAPLLIIRLKIHASSAGVLNRFNIRNKFLVFVLNTV